MRFNSPSRLVHILSERVDTVLLWVYNHNRNPEREISFFYEVKVDYYRLLYNKIKSKKIMPFRDGTGPLGQGPMTGRGLGLCGGGMGFGRGYGRGRGWRRWGYYPSVYPVAQPTAKEEKEMVKEEMNALKEQIKVFEDRLQELKKK